MLVFHLFRKLIRSGRLTVIDAHGRTHHYGGQSLAGIAPVIVRLHDPRLHWRMGLRPSLAIGEAWMAGTLTVEDGTLYDFLALCVANLREARGGGSQGSRIDDATGLLRRFQQFNPLRRARRNVAHHYDLSDEFYRLFLDSDRQYSCAYFRHPGATLEEAQAEKKQHIAAKLLLQDGQRVLDIGCGWGGLALTLARTADVDVTGITLSTEQHKVAQRRAAEAGLAGRLRFALQDYRLQGGRFDRIVSVGMFEHVGVNHYRTFFDRIRDLLTEDGVALLHSIGRADKPGSTNAWIRKYIFPGGYVPALSEVLTAVERSGLYVTDIEVLRLHYAETLREWRRRFMAQRDRAAELYDERFCRMWEFYLTGCEVAFRHQGLMVFQMQLARRLDAVPLTRDYIHAEDTAMARRRA